MEQTINLDLCTLRTIQSALKAEIKRCERIGKLMKDRKEENKRVLSNIESAIDKIHENLSR